MHAGNHKKVMLSAIQSTNVPHLGNYLGAIKRWAEMQNDYDCFFFVVDLHAITVFVDPELRRKHLYESFAYNLAAGLSPEKSAIFVQSHVPEHAELSWILNCFTQVGELQRMTQFKDKSQKNEQAINSGILTYPILMAADILLYDTNLVPVGEDQKQHIELTRNIANRFNNKLGNCFVIPEPMIATQGARIMDLQTPDSKMSKSSASPAGTVFMNDTDKKILKKIRSAVTDSGSGVDPDNVSPGLRNLADIMATFEQSSVESVLDQFSGQSYGVFKTAVADAVVAKLGPIREEAERLLKDQAALESVMAVGAQKAREKASQKVAAVKKALGLL